MPRYRKKPVQVVAIQWTGRNYIDVSTFMGMRPERQGTGGTTLLIPTLEGTMKVSTDDWIIRGVANELYPCKPDIFEATYEGPIDSLGFVIEEDS